MMNGVVHVARTRRRLRRARRRDLDLHPHADVHADAHSHADADVEPTVTLSPTPADPARLLLGRSPCRAIDTRSVRRAARGRGRRALSRSEDTCGIPATARAVSINITVASPTAAGDLRLFPGGTSQPLVSTINYRAGQTRANNAIVALGALADLAIKCDQSTGTVHVIIDVNGYAE